MNGAPAPVIDNTRFRSLSHTGFRPPVAALVPGDRRHDWDLHHHKRPEFSKAEDEPRKPSKIAISSLLCDTKHHDHQMHYDDDTEDGDNMDGSDNTSESPRPYRMFDEATTATSVTSPSSSTYGDQEDSARRYFDDKMDHDCIDNGVLPVERMKVSDKHEQLPPLNLVEPPSQYFQREPTSLPRLFDNQRPPTSSSPLPLQLRLTGAATNNSNSSQKPRWPAHLSRRMSWEESESSVPIRLPGPSDVQGDHTRSRLMSPSPSPSQPFSSALTSYNPPRSSHGSHNNNNNNNNHDGYGFRPVRRSIDDYGAVNHYHNNHDRAMTQAGHSPYASGFQRFQEQEHQLAPRFPHHMENNGDHADHRPLPPSSRLALPSFNHPHQFSAFSSPDRMSGQAQLQRPTPILGHSGSGVPYNNAFHGATSSPPYKPAFPQHHNLSHSSLHSPHLPGADGGSMPVSRSSSMTMVERDNLMSSPAPPNPNYSQLLKAKRKRANANQLQVLNEVFQHTFFPSTEMRIQLGKQLGMSPRTVQIWFQNKRQSWRTKNKLAQTETGRKDMDGMEGQGAADYGSMREEDDYEQERVGGDGESTVTSPAGASMGDINNHHQRARRRSSLSSMSSSCDDASETTDNVPSESAAQMLGFMSGQNREGFKGQDSAFAPASKRHHQHHPPSRYNSAYDQRRASSPQPPVPRFGSSVAAELHQAQNPSQFSDQQQQQQRPFAALNPPSSASSGVSLFTTHPPRSASISANDEPSHDQKNASQFPSERRMSPKLSHYRQHPYQPQGISPVLRSPPESHSNGASAGPLSTGGLAQALPSPTLTPTPPLSQTASSPATTPPSAGSHTTTPTVTSPREVSHGFQRIRSPPSSFQQFPRQYRHPAEHDRRRDAELGPNFPPSVTQSSQFSSFAGSIVGSSSSSSSSKPQELPRSPKAENGSRPMYMSMGSAGRSLA
ncbi:hypothetical protein BC936DRAFT_141621 [Jimgerdemannia flammicorona]|uniref:Homeobox domain-containing protein n=1 Tax=Jimgerdemannia flammicorona TaxID=994334 RepID=A0A433A1Y1_9FUNG|nr:hypothetical protein BC936DRAFT_141621 [Jimgerdemannia flammicorona]